MIEESSHGQVLKSTFTRCPPYDLCRVGIVRPRFWRGTSEPAHDLRPTWGGQEPLGAPSAGKPGLLDRRPGYPFGIYLQAYEHRHKPIVLDDVDGLYADRLGIRLLKALGQTEQTKTLSWQTAAPTLARSGIPRQFTTTSRIALVGNDWRTLNADVAALEDRGHLLLFEPTPLEVHRQAARWFWDQEVFDFVAD